MPTILEANLRELGCAWNRNNPRLFGEQPSLAKFSNEKAVANL
jgi:hypothetical protein